MAKPLLTDELWQRIEPHIPPEPPKPKGGRPPIPNRACLTGILFVLKTGTPWEYLPREMGCGSGMTCWRRLRDWQAAGVWQKIWQALLDELGLAEAIDWSTSAMDSCSVRALFGGPKTGPNPTDRGKNGSKRHLIVDGQGIPLAIEHTGANVHDSEMAIALVDGIPPIKQPRGRPRKRPDEVLADRAYDAEEKIRRPLRQRKIKPLIAKRYTENGSGLGKFRYVVEAAFDWLFNQRRLRVRYEKRDDIHQAFLIIGCLLICWRKIMRFC
ncbi:MAG: IS5 family transposase [Methanosarcinaceae archaeon]|nr:IS5 family transposase [Methanosarcinaceae archaeon]